MGYKFIVFHENDRLRKFYREIVGYCQNAKISPANIYGIRLCNHHTQKSVIIFIH